ncbi:MAG: PD-(D/E)XK nuclease family protein [Patescibacteria group bacterium]
MSKDKFTAVWVSHTSIGDFIKCPRAYYLKNIYKNPQTGHKIKLMSPPLALGQTVHEVVESLSNLPTEIRFKTSLVEKFNEAWKKVQGKNGGFTNPETEEVYKKRGEEMLLRVMQNPGPLKNLAVKIKMQLPYCWLSEDDNIILCGKIDWLEYMPESDTVHIIDFKTSRGDEDPNSLQLGIYYLLAERCQKRHVAKASYWYIDRSDAPVEQKLPDLKEYEDKILDLAKQVKLARQLERFKCPHQGCQSCNPMEAILKGEAQFVGVNAYGDDVYLLEDSSMLEEESVIL